MGKPRQGKALIAWLTKASFCSNHELRFAAVVKAAAMLPNEGSAGPKGLGRLLRLLPLSEFKQGLKAVVAISVRLVLSQEVRNSLRHRFLHRKLLDIQLRGLL